MAGRPARSCAYRPRGAGAGCGAPGRRARRTAAEPGPQRAEGVVGEQPGPHQVPERGDHGVVGRGRPRRPRPAPAPARSASSRKNSAPPPVGGAAGSGRPSAASSARCSGVAATSGSGSGSSRSATSVGATASQPSRAGQRAAADPGDLAGRGQLVEQGRAVAGQPGGQHQRLQRAGRQRRPGQLLHHPEDVLGAGRAAHPTPAAALARRSGRPARPAGTAPAPAAPRARPRRAAGPARPAAAAAAPRRRSTPGRRRARRSRSAADPTGRSSPRTSRPAPTSRSSTPVTTATPSPNRCRAPGGRERAVRAGVAQRPDRPAGRRPAR